MFFNLVGILKSGYLCNVILKTIFSVSYTHLRAHET